MSATQGSKTVTGHRFRVKADNMANTAGEIKTRIHQEYNIPTDKIILTVNGVLLKDEDAVAAGARLDIEFAPDVLVQAGSSSSATSVSSTGARRGLAGVMITPRTYLRSTKLSGSAADADARRLMPPPPDQKPIRIVYVDEDDDDWLSDDDQDES